jgi:pimeloyl-ACP methyl ester carboxylesterase
MQWLITLLGVYAGLALFVMLFQRKLIYVPSRFPVEAAEQLARKEGFRPWRNQRGVLIGWHLPSRTNSKASVLIVHGNGGCAANRGYLARPIHEAAAVDVYVLEYPGYGCRAGSPSLQSILAAADNAIETLTNDKPVYVVGESLGTGPAAHVAGKNPRRIAGLALFAPYDKLSSVAQRQMPWLPVGLLLRDRFHPAASLAHYRGPVKIILAEADSIIPAKFGQRLHDGYAGTKALEVIQGAGHNDIAGQTPGWWAEVFRFWETNDHARIR